MADEGYKSRTLFIRNLAFKTTGEKLTALFEDVGPIKQCFVVKDKESNTCKGYGYVKFALIEDAIKAKETVTSLDGRKLFVSFADYKKKKIRKPTKKKQEDSDEEDEEEGKKKEVNEIPVTKTEDDKKKDLKYLKAKIVVVTGFHSQPTLEQVEHLVSRSNVKKVAKVVYPVDGRSVPTAFLKFKCVRDANRAIRRLQDETKTGCKLAAVQLNKEFAEAPQKTLRNHRLIIRNLHFQLESDELKSRFENFGEITEVHMPTRPDGKKKGFGFIQFTNHKSAKSAISGMNGVKIKGRPIAVDWSLAKGTYEKIKDDDNSSSSGEDEGSFSAESEEASEEEVASEKEEEEEEESASSDEDDSDEESESDSDSDEGFSDDEQEKATPVRKKGKEKVARKSDIDEGKTLFIRNVPFNCEEEDLQDVLADFGDISYCKLVMDPLTQHAKGTAFVKFETVEQADKCLAKAEDISKDGGIVLHDRPLKVSKALKREEAADLKEKEKKKDTTDKRNLFLIREGLVRPGTAAAEGLSKSDLVKRTKVEAEMRQKLKNPNIFVSSTRLCVQNLPLDITDKMLRHKMKEEAGDKNANITECRIMRDLKRVNAKGVGKSHGFGFVNFSEHQHALQALRSTNNVVFNNKRLIVHFSLEHQKMVLAQQKKLERIKFRNATAVKTDEKQEKGLSDAQSTQKVAKGNRGKMNPNVKRKTEQDDVARQLYTGPKGLPSHSGPKVRHKARQGQDQGQGKKKNQGMVPVQKRPNPDNSEQGPAKKKKKKSKKGKKGPQTDDFDRLVQSYKNKMAASSGSNRKWFD